MRTININLIDDQTKESNKSKMEMFTDDSDINPKIKFASIVILISVCIVFATSFGIWFISNLMLEKTGKKLSDLKDSHEKLELELSQTTKIHKNIQNEKKTLEIKLQAQNLISTSVLPWHKILTNISKAVPKNVKITEISKISEIKNTSPVDVIIIKGQIPCEESKNNSLKSISYFVLNINNNAPADTALEKATIKKFDYDDKENLYNFEISSALKIVEKKSDKQEKQIAQKTSDDTKQESQTTEEKQDK